MKLLLAFSFLFFAFSLLAQQCKQCPQLYLDGKYDEVITEVSQIAKTAEMPDLVLLAKSYQNLGMKKDAIDAYSYILLNDENNVDALVAVGALFIDMEQYENALFSTERALKFDSLNKFALYNKAVIYYYQEDYKKLYDFVDQHLQKDSKQTDLLFVKAMSYITKKEFPAAISTFEEIEQKQAEMLNINFYYGYALYKSDRFEEAKKRFRQAIDEKDTQLIDAYYYLAQIYVQENNKVEACEAYTNAINLGDITITKEADDFCNAKKDKKNKLKDRGVRASF